MVERKIKELAIAMEALSRINGASTFMYEIENLLSEAIKQAKLEDYTPEPKPKPAPNLDDDIPF